MEEWGGRLATIVLSVAEAPAHVRAQARACLIKSNTAESMIIEQLLQAVSDAAAPAAAEVSVQPNRR